MGPVTCIFSLSLICAGKFAPSDAKFSKTVNVGDRDVQIAMMKRAEPQTHGADIRWRKDGGPAIR